MDILGISMVNCLKEFMSLHDDEARIRLVYGEMVATRKVELKNDVPKNIHITHHQKEMGNNHFRKREFLDAIYAYNRAIVRCPQDTDVNLTILCITIANRSAVYHELQEYQKVLNDLHYIEEIGKYPNFLRYKILFRKAKCFEALRKKTEAVSAYYLTLESIGESNLDDANRAIKLKEIQEQLSVLDALDSSESEGEENSSSDVEEVEATSWNPKFPAVISKVHFDRDDIQGRFAIARDDIEQGTTILVEEPYAASTNVENWLTNCHYCCLSSDQPVACPRCCNVIFCSTDCLRTASYFHDFECPILETVLALEWRGNGYLAMRMLSQKPYSFFESQREYLTPFLSDNRNIEPLPDTSYRSDDYRNVFFLGRNVVGRFQPRLLTLTCIAVQFLRILKLGNYFPFESDDRFLREEEVYIGALLSRHLQIISFNTHGIFELRKYSNPMFMEVTISRDQHIGAAVYPTMSLFNHSCNPNVTRYHVGRKIVVRTNKPVRAGELLNDNYGPNYSRMERFLRRRHLVDNFSFFCNCPPCTFQWPTFQEMKERELRFPCETEGCSTVFVIDLKCESIPTQCYACRRTFVIKDELFGCMVANDLMKEPDSLALQGKYKKAIKKFFSVLHILNMFVSPPHPLLIIVGEKIQRCMVQFGNKRSPYLL